MEKRIICNSIKTPDGTILISHHVHDYKEHKDKKSKELYTIDGGREYLRRSVNKVPYKEMTIYDDAPFEIIRKVFYWGTYGKVRRKKLRYVALAKLKTEHILNILLTQHHLRAETQTLFWQELLYREQLKENINVW